MRLMSLWLARKEQKEEGGPPAIAQRAVQGMSSLSVK